MCHDFHYGWIGRCLVIQHFKWHFEQTHWDNWPVRILSAEIYVYDCACKCKTCTKCMLINEHVISLFAACEIGKVPELHQCSYVLTDKWKKKKHLKKKRNDHNSCWKLFGLFGILCVWNFHSKLNLLDKCEYSLMVLLIWIRNLPTQWKEAHKVV